MNQVMDTSLFPPAAQCVELLTQPGTCDLSRFEALHPQEKILVSHAVDARKAEFGDARWCAHQALAKLGRASTAPILRGERGVPIFPASVSGSLTHTDGLRAAVVAPRLLVRSIGLDAERARPLPERILESIARVNELAQISELKTAGVSCPDTLLFCAKEATYKAWFPLTHRWLDFDEAEIDLRVDGTFVSYLLAQPAPVPFFEGRWHIRSGYVVAAIAVH